MLPTGRYIFKKSKVLRHLSLYEEEGRGKKLSATDFVQAVGKREWGNNFDPYIMTLILPFIVPK